MTITLFEHQARSYESLGWSTTHPAINELERLNEVWGEELLRLGRRELRASHFVGVLRTRTSTVQILPKLDYDSDGSAEAERGSARLSAEHSPSSIAHHICFSLFSLTRASSTSGFRPSVAEKRSSVMRCVWDEYELE